MILITGGSSGLGAALANLYDLDGHALLISGRNQHRLERVAEKMSVRAKVQQADLCDLQDCTFLLDALEQVPEMVIHCAGSGYFAPIEEQDPLAVNNLLQNNVTSTIFLLRELVRRYRNHKVKVVIVMSTASLTAKAGESTYCAVKWAVRGLIESVRLELKGSPMTLIAVYPGGMATDFWPTSGKVLDTSEFMSAEEGAIMLKQALISTEHGFVSDITINRS